MLTRFILGMTLFLFTDYLSAQPPFQIDWSVAYGGTYFDDAHNALRVRDRGYVLIGKAISSDGDVAGMHGTFDAWVIKTDSMGQIEWKRCYGGDHYDDFFAIRETPDGGYIAAGYTKSTDGDVTGNHGDEDAWVVKMDEQGDIEWQKCYGGTNLDEAWDIQITPDGGYIFVGYAGSNDGDVQGNHGGYDYWIVKLDVQGNLLWQKCYGGTSIDRAYSVACTTDGGYIVTGESQSQDGNVESYQGGTDMWTLKLNFEGKIEWQQGYGGFGGERGNEIQQTMDGGYMLFGNVSSNSGQVIGYHGGLSDQWAVKLDKDGGIEWQRTMGGSETDYGRNFAQTPDSGYIYIGSTNSIDGDVIDMHGVRDLWLTKLTKDGVLEWQLCLGGSLADLGEFILPLSNNSYFVFGSSWSNDGDVVGGVNGKTDFWRVFKKVCQS